MKTKKTGVISLEAAGIILAVFGAFLLVSCLMPLINPGFANVNFGDVPFFSVGNMVCLGMAILIIVCGVLCSRKADKLKKNESSTSREPDNKTGKTL
jgi:hypothetical protein